MEFSNKAPDELFDLNFIGRLGQYQTSCLLAYILGLPLLSIREQEQVTSGVKI